MDVEDTRWGIEVQEFGVVPQYGARQVRAAIIRRWLKPVVGPCP